MSQNVFFKPTLVIQESLHNKHLWNLQKKKKNDTEESNGYRKDNMFKTTIATKLATDAPKEQESIRTKEYNHLPKYR